MATLDYRSEEKVYAFETEAIRGTLRPGNEFPHHGLTHLVHKATGIEFVHPLYAILNLYRFMHRPGGWVKRAWTAILAIPAKASATLRPMRTA